MTITVRDFVNLSYRLINPSNPTVPLHGNDQAIAIQLLGQLLDEYAASGLLLTIAKTATVPLIQGQQFVIIGPSTYLPTPDIPLGRLAQYDSAWLLLSGVTYPLINMSRDEYLASFKYEPLQGLPRFALTYPDTEVMKLQLYPAPSQFFDFYIRGKFQLTNLTANDNLDALPSYYVRFLRYALAKEIALTKGRAAAWSPILEQELTAAQAKMEGASEVNLTITGDRASLLNGAWRVRAGV